MGVIANCFNEKSVRRSTTRYPSVGMVKMQPAGGIPTQPLWIRLPRLKQSLPFPTAGAEGDGGKYIVCGLTLSLVLLFHIEEGSYVEGVGKELVVSGVDIGETVEAMDTLGESDDAPEMLENEC